MAKKTKFNKTQVKQALGSLVFDPQERPISYAFDTNNPHYALCRAQEYLSEVDVINSPESSRVGIQRAVQMLVTTLLMLDANGPKNAERKTGSEDSGGDNSVS